MRIERDILATLAYFDIFEYPLNEAELYQFLPNTYTHALFIDGLNRLCTKELVYRFEELYSLQDKYALVTRRRQGNARAENLLKTAEKIASFLSWFPFVRGVAVSGSLSKHFADEKSDIDFFIITRKNRLWIARTLLLIFRRVAVMFNKGDWFCLNYFLDEQALEIEEKNIFIAIEIATLIPFVGKDSFSKFYFYNEWYLNYLPVHSKSINSVKEPKSSFIKKAVEAIFNNWVGSSLDTFLMKLTDRRWQRKTEKGELNKRGILMSMSVSKHFSKPDPTNFQKKLLFNYGRKLESILNLFEIKEKQMVSSSSN